jgi:hypothetical protein
MPRCGVAMNQAASRSPVEQSHRAQTVLGGRVGTARVLDRGAQL